MATRFTILCAALLAFGCSDPREDLERLPGEVAALFREGEIADALACLHPEFKIEGMGPTRTQQILLYQQGSDPIRPHVAAVILDPEEDGQNERSLVVIGVLPRGDPTKVSPRDLRPFRVEALARLVDGDWKILSARLIR